MVLQLPHLSNVAISSCLVGIKCRYDGNCSKNLEKYKSCLNFCPEVLGGLSIPRIPCKIINGNGLDVINGNSKIIGEDSNDYTKNFIDGAKHCLRLCKENNISIVILKEKSPSCGCNFIYNDDILVKGMGVLAAMLKQHGIKTISDCEV